MNNQLAKKTPLSYPRPVRFLDAFGRQAFLPGTYDLTGVQKELVRCHTSVRFHSFQRLCGRNNGILEKWKKAENQTCPTFHNAIIPGFPEATLFQMGAGLKILPVTQSVFGQA